MIVEMDIEGPKVISPRMLGNHKPDIPVKAFLTVLASHLGTKKSIDHTFTVLTRTMNHDQTSYNIFATYEISVFGRQIFSKLCYIVLDVCTNSHSMLLKVSEWTAPFAIQSCIFDMQRSDHQYLSSLPKSLTYEGSSLLSVSSCHGAHIR